MTTSPDPYLQRWAADPDGGALFPDRRNALLAHDPACRSLGRAWMPRRRGSVCPSDLEPCDDCDIWFFTDGLGLYDIDGDDTPLCSCCAQKRGIA